MSIPRAQRCYVSVLGSEMGRGKKGMCCFVQDKTGTQYLVITDKYPEPRWPSEHLALFRFHQFSFHPAYSPSSIDQSQAKKDGPGSSVLVACFSPLLGKVGSREIITLAEPAKFSNLSTTRSQSHRAGRSSTHFPHRPLSQSQSPRRRPRWISYSRFPTRSCSITCTHGYFQRNCATSPNMC